MDLSIITVTWNSAKFIQTQIESIKATCADLKYEHIVVDNNSSDNTVELLQDNKDIIFIKNNKNVGFAQANNSAVNKANGRYILFLNPDMELTANTNLKEMIEYMEQNKQIGIMSCKLVDKDGELNINEGPRRFPKVWEQLLLILKVPHVFPWLLNKYHYKNLDFKSIQQVDTVRGSFMLIRHDIIKKLKQAFDIRYFLWFEDVDFCRQVKELNYQVVYNPSFSCVDLIGQSFGLSDNFKRQKQFIKSMIQYFKKWESWYKWIWLVLFRPVGVVMTWVYVKIK